MKKLISTVLCAIMTFASVGCGGNNVLQNDEVIDQQVQIPNPIVEYSSVEEVKNAVDFDFNVITEIPEGYEIDKISAIGNEIVQISYTNGENEICYRVAKGIDDISGDYNKYPSSTNITIGETQVTMRGTEDNINVATWNNGEFTFAICIDAGGEGIETSVVTDMIESVI